MGYVEDVLQPGERIVYRGNVSWALFIQGMVLLGVGLGLTPFALAGGALFGYLAGVTIAVLAAGVISLVQVWIVRRTTEIAITDSRVILKQGLFNRRTLEMNLDKIESVDVRQSVLGRLLDFGDVIVRGTGAGLEPMKGIDAPLAFRKHLAAADRRLPE